MPTFVTWPASTRSNWNQPLSMRRLLLKLWKGELWVCVCVVANGLVVTITHSSFELQYCHGSLCRLASWSGGTSHGNQGGNDAPTAIVFLVVKGSILCVEINEC